MSEVNYTQAQVIDALKRIKAGESYKEQAKELSVSPDTMRGWMRKAGIAVPTRPRIDWEAVRVEMENV